MSVFQLSEELIFPNPDWADENGLLAVGGDLSPERLLKAYSLGIFPWYGENEPILWWSPDPRCVLFPEQVHVSRRLMRVLRQERFQLTSNRAFDQVVAACAEVRNDTWLIPEMQEAYRRLHELGYAHSVEAWDGTDLVGGMYGVAINGFFFGESMFHRQNDASKVVLVKLARYLARCDFELIDCQVPNAHLIRMGAKNIPRQKFFELLRDRGLGGLPVYVPVVLPEVF